MIQFVHCECCVGDGRLVVDGNYVYGRRVFGGCVVACAGADNLVLERRVVVAEFIRLGLVSEFAQIRDINDLVFGNGRSIVCKRSGSREPRDDDGGECLGCMAEIEFVLRKCMLGIFVDVDDKFFRDGRKFRIRGVRPVSKWNKLESVSLHFVSNLYARCEKLPRKAHVTENMDCIGTYNGAINRRIVDASKVDFVIDIDNQVAFIIAATAIIFPVRLLTIG